MGVGPETKKKRKPSLNISRRFLSLTREITQEKENKLLSDDTISATKDSSISSLLSMK